MLLTIGVAALACAVVAHHWPQMSPHDRADFHPLEVNLAGVQIAQLAIGVLGVLVITGEYSTGMIRATMTAVPKRLPVLWGKAVVYGLVALALTIPSTLLAFVVGEAIFSRRDIDIAFTHPGVARAVVRRRALPDRRRPASASASARSSATPPAASRRSRGSCSCCRR